MEREPIGFQWWQSLSASWKTAFAQTCFNHQDEPTSQELAHLFHAPALRFAGPSAPYPNMSLELENLSGVEALVNLEILVVSHHQVKSLENLSGLANLKSLFLFNNKLESLHGIENLSGLKQLYVQHNLIPSITPVKSLINLEEFYINDNRITSLEGLTESHSEKLEKFFCKPNDGLKQKEILRVERELSIRCRTL